MEDRLFPIMMWVLKNHFKGRFLNFSPKEPVFPQKYFWFLFLGFTLSNAILAHAQLPLFGEWMVGIMGLGLPWGLGLFFYRKPVHRPETLFREDWISTPPIWLAAVLLAGAAFLRFVQLTALSLWPLYDEGKSGYFSAQLATGAPFQMLYDFSQLPPFYIWLHGIFFKIFGISLFSLWCLPALLSILTVPAAYFAVRAHCSKTFALVFCGLVAFSFWPLYVGRFSHQGSLLLLWEFLVLWLGAECPLSHPLRGSPRPDFS